MPKLTVFITAVCVLFLIKLRWPKNKSLYDTCLIFKNVFMISDDEVPLFTIHSFIHITYYMTYKAGDQSISVELLDDLRFILCKEYRMQTSCFTN